MCGFCFSVDDIVLNIDLAPTFLDMGGVPTPVHMDGRSFLPLIRNHYRNVRGKWPDTFLIESSGRREAPEQLLEQRTRATAARAIEDLNAYISKTNIELPLKNDSDIVTMSHFSSHEGFLPLKKKKKI